jgi:hypothetical protein
MDEAYAACVAGQFERDPSTFAWGAGEHRPVVGFPS